MLQVWGYPDAVFLGEEDRAVQSRPTGRRSCRDGACFSVLTGVQPSQYLLGKPSATAKPRDCTGWARVPHLDSAAVISLHCFVTRTLLQPPAHLHRHTMIPPVL